jgi:hypothetical protein
MKITVDTPLIMSLKPCPDWPESRVREAVPEEIPIVDFLRAAHIPPQDKLWVAFRKDFCSTLIMSLFAYDCAERALTRERDAGRDPDERSWAAVDVARRHALGMATDAELAAARAAAWSAPLTTTRLPIRTTAGASARAAAWYATRAAADAKTAAGEAAWYAARATGASMDARTAAARAATSAADSAAARAAARDAALDAAGAIAAWVDEVEWQCIQLAEMLEEMK